MTKRNIILIIAIIFFALAFARFSSNEDTWLCQNGVWVKHGNPKQSEPITKCSNIKPIACTMDAKQCPDGSYVGRTPPKCEFVCPK
ncbi:MAG: hypothetical protein UR90_C0028G0010 [Parcubacteria group bacterium GW2011_GWC1_35_8]|uniref:Uncharacterized protein n=2 Tax=Candidatus Nomuraibacteriota TaxID=1752729 RepID=A0A1F6YTL1_9BACT|nr:MAG: hypothetical protein UR90_C0028G0010 [Parcubacteria group bacterium GW2011_GWC1_35_8]OGJ05703.1 MAG: hypothetical protein A2238_00560 [Candidatus Nomurabacteria bacterium RIFOXYA2_FULL_35_9]OGJ06119.1 MAG: hypothetical protein A2192_01735 [Candidatus Nomurabacteria bacterium RIFOXYA1_FULL_35_17]OGJ09706.1 MAG: hypothetical protein A2456_00065 [Candidatus Nomurabacteria bacterium RIFOXYC2_FULL_36_19]OGJ14574.1 MAG: hypothetical protein A2554_02135 [Candidatus Nomurabacteria bacterium RIF